MGRKIRYEKMKEKRLNSRKRYWPEVKDDDLWLRSETAGFTTIPRGLSLIGRIMDSLSIKKPLSNTYFTLWCYSWDEMIITIQKPYQMALESGFTGQRALSTWRGRMQKLEDLGFIKSAKGASGDWNHVVLLNPYLVVKKLYRTNDLSEDLYTTLLERIDEIGEESIMIDEDKDQIIR